MKPMMPFKLISVLVALVFLAGGTLSFAQGQPESRAKTSQKKEAKPAKDVRDKDYAVPADEKTRLVVFSYDGNLVYKIPTQDGMMTHLELRPGEKVKGFYLSDSTRWKHVVSKDEARIFIKPTLPGLFNAATLVTNERVYELTFTSGGIGEPWYQRVRWDVNQFDLATGEGVFESSSENTRSGVRGGYSGLAVMPEMDLAAVNSSGAQVGGLPKISPDRLNFGYVIEGDASFKPLSVFDDGKFTWMHMSGSPSLPALFLLSEAGAVELVNYTVHGNYLMVSQVATGFVLKLADKEVRIVKKSECTGFWCRKQ